MGGGQWQRAWRQRPAALNNWLGEWGQRQCRRGRYLQQPQGPCLRHFLQDLAQAWQKLLVGLVHMGMAARVVVRRVGGDTGAGPRAAGWATTGQDPS